jgi:hypothetical protein
MRSLRTGEVAATQRKRGPECLGVRASWPPVVAPVVMNERPAPRCKRRCYRCALSAQPIRTSTVSQRVRGLCDKLIGIDVRKPSPNLAIVAICCPLVAALAI